MRKRSPLVVAVLALLSALPLSAHGSIIFRPGEKAKVVAPGDEEINGNAQELYAIAQEAEAKGNADRAIKAYRTIVRKYPKDATAATSCYRAGQLLEQRGNLYQAAQAYKVLVETFTKSPDFDEAIEAQFRIGEAFMNGKKRKFVGIPIGDNLDRAVDVFAEIVRTAPYGKYTARAQFDIGLSRERQGNNDAAVQAYQAVIDKFPHEPIAVDAQYQLGYIWMDAAKHGTKDSAAAGNAKTAFEDFLQKYPRSEKAQQARQNLEQVSTKQTSDSFRIARYYDVQKMYKAAVIYYMDVVKQEPGSPHAGAAQKRVEQLRAKFGDAVMEPVIAAQEGAKKKRATASRERSSSARQSADPAMRGGGPSDVAPLPAPDNDAALPPPASLAPENTTAPEPEPGVAPATSSDAGAASDGSTTSPDASASPAP